jgi:DNA-binding NarL/FixJ family response regulator
MKDRRWSPRRRAIVVLFRSGFSVAELARLFKLKTSDVSFVIRKAL